MAEVTPRLTLHARERCVEMGISTKVAKRIVQHADVTIPGAKGSGRRVAISRLHPEYRVVYVEKDGLPLVVTVDFNEEEDYVRNGATYILKSESEAS